MTAYDYLKQIQEPCPTWLKAHQPGDKVPHDFVSAGRVVFYPGSGSDGHAVKLFGSTRAAHTFIYADYAVTREEILRDLKGRGDTPYNAPFSGYSVYDCMDLEIQDLVPTGWHPHIFPKRAHQPTDGFQPYGTLVILSRKVGMSEAHGPEKMAILFLGADGIATYDALFCQESNRRAPFAMLIQDHGFGGFYASFGKGGLLHELANTTNVWPEYLLIGDNTHAWPRYRLLEDVEADIGGMHQTPRRLFKSD